MRDRELTLENCKHIKEWDYQGKVLIERAN